MTIFFPKTINRVEFFFKLGTYIVSIRIVLSFVIVIIILCARVSRMCMCVWGVCTSDMERVYND